LELKSLSQGIECARMESWCLGMIKECLDGSSMRLGVPFIAPRQLGAVEGNLGRQSWKANLAFCRVAHRTVRCATGQPLFMSGARFPSIPGAADRCNFGLIGAPDSVRCTPDSPVPPADHWRRPRVARVLRGRPLRWRPLAHRTVRCTTG
jgi:hypothetical protein